MGFVDVKDYVFRLLQEEISGWSFWIPEIEEEGKGERMRKGERVKEGKGERERKREIRRQEIRKIRKE